MASQGPYHLPPLPYAYEALEPYISSQIMTLHHTKHHATYITNLNAALSSLNALSPNTPSNLPLHLALQAAIKFHGGGHINHSLFWTNLAPASTPAADPAAAPRAITAIEARWGSLAAFQAAFGKALLGIQGSGWGWLVKREGEELDIVTSKDQDPVLAPAVPLLGVDMWEHAYYLQYLNNKAEYVKNIWHIVNWATIEGRFTGSADDAFKVLKASM